MTEFEKEVVHFLNVISDKIGLALFWLFLISMNTCAHGGFK